MSMPCMVCGRIPVVAKPCIARGWQIIRMPGFTRWCRIRGYGRRLNVNGRYLYKRYGLPRSVAW